MKSIEKMPMLDYFEILNAKWVEVKKAIERQEKLERERRFEQAKAQAKFKR